MTSRNDGGSVMTRLRRLAGLGLAEGPPPDHDAKLARMDDTASEIAETRLRLEALAKRVEVIRGR